MTELMRAHHQWCNRPDDERFLTLEDLRRATRGRADRSTARVSRHDHFMLQADERTGLAIKLAGLEDLAEPTHWSFGQLCSRAKVHSKTARRTHPEIAADLVNYGMRFDENETPRSVDSSNIMLHRKENGELEMRCMVGPNYGRVYDHRVVEAVMEINADGRWHIPSGSTFTAEEAAKSKRATTLYASDRDVFIFLVDESRPLEINGEVLYRGFMVWNSEVGNLSLGATTFLYRRTCDNRIVWGAQDVRTLRIVHSSGAPDRFAREMKPILRDYAEASLSATTATIKEAQRMEIGNTPEAATEWLSKRRQFTQKEAARVVKQAEMEEGECHTLWQAVQGGTALARGIKHTDSRIQQEKKVSNLLRLAEARI